MRTPKFKAKDKVRHKTRKNRGVGTIFRREGTSEGEYFYSVDWEHDKRQSHAESELYFADGPDGSAEMTGGVTGTVIPIRDDKHKK